MGRVEFLPSSRTVVERKSEYSPGINGDTLGLDRIVNSLPVSKDGQEPSFEDVFKKAYGDFPKLKKHADLHPSEYENATNLINGLPTQLQDKWRLLRLYLWYQYGSSTFGEIFNLTPDKTRKETALLSDLPDELINMVSERLEEGDDEDEEEIAENTTTVPLLNKYNGRVNPEKRAFVILAEGGQKWSKLTDRQRIVLQERYLADHSATFEAIARQLETSSQSVTQFEAAGLRKLGFSGDAINLTRQQLKNIFRDAKEEDINSLSPKERKLLERLYGSNAQDEHSYPTIKSVAADINVDSATSHKRHQKAIQKLLHTKKPIRINKSLPPTSEQVELMRQKFPLEGTDKVAKEMGVTVGVVRRWLRQERIESRPEGRPPISPSPEVLEFIKANYLEMSIVAMAKLTGHKPEIIARSLRAAGIPIGNRTC